MQTRTESEEEDRRVNKEKVVDFAEGDEFYHDLESYGWDWYRSLDLPKAPEKRYYSKMKVRQALRLFKEIVLTI